MMKFFLAILALLVASAMATELVAQKAVGDTCPLSTFVGVRFNGQAFVFDGLWEDTAVATPSTSACTLPGGTCCKPAVDTAITDYFTGVGKLIDDIRALFQQAVDQGRNEFTVPAASDEVPRYVTDFFQRLGDDYFDFLQKVLNSWVSCANGQLAANIGSMCSFCRPDLATRTDVLTATRVKLRVWNGVCTNLATKCNGQAVAAKEFASKLLCNIRQLAKDIRAQLGANCGGQDCSGLDALIAEFEACETNAAALLAGSDDPDDEAKCLATDNPAACAAVACARWRTALGTFDPTAAIRVQTYILARAALQIARLVNFINLVTPNNGGNTRSVGMNTAIAELQSRADFLSAQSKLLNDKAVVLKARYQRAEARVAHMRTAETETCNDKSDSCVDVLTEGESTPVYDSTKRSGAVSMGPLAAVLALIALLAALLM